ncbi:MAG: hypothetical protein ACU0BK_15465 [Shimia sp.]|uniref:hypothetical protein n=2 Tax=Shimia sp. TaxID=1954381 RepID=UPI0040590519
MSELSYPPAEASVIIAETRHAILSRTVNSPTSGSAPVVLIMPLTAANAPDSFASEEKLNAALSAASHPVAKVAWRRLWNPTGKERFAPRVNDLTELVLAMGASTAPLHIAAIGNGALVALKWLSSLAKPTSKVSPQILSLTFITPELHIFDRTPRTSLRDVPQACCVVADAALDWRNAELITTKLPSPPEFALAEDQRRFMLSTADRDADAHILDGATTFEGDWRLSWADWLYRVAKTPAVA